MAQKTEQEKVACIKNAIRSYQAHPEDPNNLMALLLTYGGLVRGQEQLHPVDLAKAIQDISGQDIDLPQSYARAANYWK